MKGKPFFFILALGLVAFEVFNFGSTRFSLDQVFAGEAVWGISWATALAMAFSAVDFAGLARIFTPEKTFAKEPPEIKMLFGAWIFASLFNAALTWYGVAELISGRSDIGNEALSHSQMISTAPVFIAVLVFITRLMLIATLAMTVDHALADARKSVEKKTSKRSSKSSRTNANSRNPLNPRHAARKAFEPRPAQQSTLFDRGTSIPPAPPLFPD